NAAARRDQIEVGCSLPAQPFDHCPFEAFEADRRELEDGRDILGRHVDIVVAEADEHPLLRTMNQLDDRFEDDRAGTLRADQRASDVEIVLGKQLIEVVAGHPPRSEEHTSELQSRRDLVCRLLLEKKKKTKKKR